MQSKRQKYSENMHDIVLEIFRQLGPTKVGIYENLVEIMLINNGWITNYYLL